MDESPSRQRRTRPPLSVTLSPTGRAALVEVAASRGLTVSALVEQLAREAHGRLVLARARARSLGAAAPEVSK